MRNETKYISKTIQLFEFILKFLVSEKYFETTLFDFRELYNDLLVADGYKTATFWYIKQLCKMLPGRIFNTFYFGGIMFKNHFKIVLRNIYKYKTFSFINIFGLAIGIACSFMIMLWIHDELKYDKFHDNYDNIYRIVGDWEKHQWDGFEGTPFPVSEVAVNSSNQVKNSCRLYNQNRKVFKVDNISFYEDAGIMADKSLFEIFNFQFLHGDIETAFSNQDGIIINERLSKKYFGTVNSIGKKIIIEGKQFFVTAVMKNIPEQSHLQFDYINPMRYKREISDGGSTWNAFNYLTYLLLDYNSSPDEIGRILTKAGLENGCRQVEEGVKFRLQPLSEVYLDGRSYERSYIKLGDKKYIYIFSSIAIFVLLIACINFMNLSTARVSSRLKEIGLRKTIGADRKNLIKQFYGESFITAVISGLFSLIIIHFTLTEFNQLSGKSLSLDYSDYSTIAMLLSVIIFTGILSGTYPALYLSSFSPVKIMKGITINSGSKFRKTMVIIQFSLTSILFICSGIIYQQFNFIQNKKLGINTHNLIHIPLKENIAAKYHTVKNKMLESTLVINASGHWNNFTNTNWRSTVPIKQQNQVDNVDIICSVIDYDYFETLEINLISGNEINRQSIENLNTNVLINETFANVIGIDKAIGTVLNIANVNYKIVGIASDINYQSLKTQIGNRVYFVEDMSQYDNEGMMILKLSGSDTKNAINYVESVWNEFNKNTPFEYQFFDQEYQKLYETEYKSSTIINLFTLFTMLVSCLGLFGLAIFIAEKSKKEIGIRKILGSNVRSLIFRLNQEFLKWVIISNVIAWPIAFYISKELLKSYAYKVSISPLVFIISFLITVSIAFFTVSLQSYKATQTNPIDILRTE